jgi:CubicO group peptidase (beta-lactamase class C family)
MHHSISYLLLGTAPLMLASCGSLDRATDVATGYVSHQLCSATFVSKVEPEQFYREAIAPILEPVGFLSGHQVDRERAQVTASFAGVAEARAVDRGPLGCLVLHGEPPAPVSLSPHAPAPALLPDIAGPQVVEPDQPALKQALDRAFTENAAPPYRNTKAVVVVHNGRVIAERYAAGYGVDTQVMGWSATKSVTNALIGILVRQGKLSVEGPAPIAPWADPKDPRHAISIDNLLRMNSGLNIGDSLTARASTAFDPSAYMVFGVRDMAAFAEKAPLKAAPGTSWNYTNGNTILLSRIIRDKTGGDAASVLAFARRELFDKLGMRHVTLEFDATGTPIGSSHMLASARTGRVSACST